MLSITAPYLQNRGIFRMSGLDVRVPDTSPGNVNQATPNGHFVKFSNERELLENLARHDVTLLGPQGGVLLTLPGASLEPPRVQDTCPKAVLDSANLQERLQPDGTVEITDKTHFVINSDGFKLYDTYTVSPQKVIGSSCRQGQGAGVTTREVNAQLANGSLLVSDRQHPEQAWIIAPLLSPGWLP